MSKPRTRKVDSPVVLPKLHPGQLRVKQSPARFKVVMCGRRWGKTVKGLRTAADAAIAAQQVGWFVPGYKYAGEVWRELVQRLGPITQAKNEQERRLELITGGVIEVWTMDSDDPARGRDYDLVIVDEAGLVAGLLPIWQSAIRPTLVDRRGKALFLGTPKGRRHGFVVLFNRGASGEDPEWASFRASTLENPHIPAEEIEAARRELPPEIFAQEFEGIPTDDGANPFGLDAIRGAVSALSKHPPVVFGVDVARAMDWTVVAGLDAWQRVAVIERWQAPWAVTKGRIKTLVGDVPIVGDATGVGDAIMADLQGLGVSVTPYVFTQPSKLRLMQRLIAAFQAGTIRIGDAPWLAAELESFEFTYTASGVKYEAPAGLHDDGVMALALALHGWDRVQGVAPSEEPPAADRPDDPFLVARPDEGIALSPIAGDFQSQLPTEGW
jgi:hypothetical protein